MKRVLCANESLKELVLSCSLGGYLILPKNPLFRFLHGYTDALHPVDIVHTNFPRNHIKSIPITYNKQIYHTDYDFNYALKAVSSLVTKRQSRNHTNSPSVSLCRYEGSSSIAPWYHCVVEWKVYGSVLYLTDGKVKISTTCLSAKRMQLRQNCQMLNYPVAGKRYEAKWIYNFYSCTPTCCLTLSGISTAF